MHRCIFSSIAQTSRMHENWDNDADVRLSIFRIESTITEPHRSARGDGVVRGKISIIQMVGEWFMKQYEIVVYDEDECSESIYKLQDLEWIKRIGSSVRVLAGFQ